MATSFAINDKIRVIGGEKEYIGKTGVIIKDGDKQRIPAGFRKLGEGFKTEEGQQQWVIMLDNKHETKVILEDNLEKIS